MDEIKKILVTGGCGYVGSVLVEKLLKKDYYVRVLDLLIYNPDIPEIYSGYENFEMIKGDIRDENVVKKAVEGMDCVIHLAAISNDPTGELDEKLTKSVNYEAVKLLLDNAKKYRVKRFINASSSSVFGINKDENITEESKPMPITLYSKYKMESEKLVNQAGDDNFIVVNLRPATICGYSPRQRFDLTVNAMAKDALTKGLITVQGGDQRRPQITMQEVTDIYVKLVGEKKELISGQTFNAGFENITISDTAELIKKILAPRDIKIVKTDSKDLRDYHISSEKIKNKLGYIPRQTVKDAVLELSEAFKKGVFKNAEEDKYYNIKKMKLEDFYGKK